MGTGRTMLIAVVLVALVAPLVTCSEPEPEAGPATTLPTKAAEGCETDDLLACARRSTIGDLVPDEPVAASGTPITLGMVDRRTPPPGPSPSSARRCRRPSSS